MNLKDFHKQLSEFFEDMKRMADEAVAGFAIDSPTGGRPLKSYGDDDEDEEKEEIYEAQESKRVMIDFDKTIYPYKNGWDGGAVEGDPYPDAKKSIDFLKDKGYEIVIFTTRASRENAETDGSNLEDRIQTVKNYLTNNEIYFDRITGDKIFADFYIDDKAIHIKNGNWNNVISQIKKRESL